MEKDFSFVQVINALEPIVFTLDPPVILVSLVHPTKALLSITLTLEPILTDVTEVFL